MQRPFKQLLRMLGYPSQADEGYLDKGSVAVITQLDLQSADRLEVDERTNSLDESQPADSRSATQDRRRGHAPQKF